MKTFLFLEITGNEISGKMRKVCGQSERERESAKNGWKGEHLPHVAELPVLLHPV